MFLSRHHTAYGLAFERIKVGFEVGQCIQESFHPGFVLKPDDGRLDLFEDLFPIPLIALLVVFSAARFQRGWRG
jgi:hypothetical protein